MPFTRPLLEIERAANLGLIDEPIIIQSGKTVYASPRMTLIPFFGSAEFENMYERASLIICQAGVGSIMLGLEKRKKVIAIARSARFDEHIDEHQSEILGLFSKIGAVLEWKGQDDLPAVLARANTFVSAGYRFEKERISEEILHFLRGNAAK